MNAEDKKSFKKVFNENKWFFIPYLLFLIFGMLLIIFLPRGNEVILLNQNRTYLLDYFFRYITYLGDGFVVIIAVLVITIIRLRFALLTFLTYAISGIFVQIVKNIALVPRPKAFFAEGVLDYIEGVKVYSANSFPSGHSATAFAFFLTIAIIVKNKYLGLVFFFLALITAISRIYTLQHFFIDTYFGSLAGVCFTIIIYLYINNNPRFHDSTLLEKPLFSDFKKKTKINP